MEQVLNDLLQLAERHSLRTVRVRDEAGRLAGILAFADTLPARQIKSVLRELCFSPGRELAAAVNLPERNDAGFQPGSCQVTVEERMQLFRRNP